MVDMISNLGTEIVAKQLQDKAAAKPDPVSQAPGELLKSFGDVLKDHLDDVQQLQTEAGKTAQTYAVGGQVELHQVMIAMEKAETAMELTMQLRNKMVQAYQEISRMNI